MYSVYIYYECGIRKRVAQDSISWFERFRGPIRVFLGRQVELPKNDSGFLSEELVFPVLEEIRRRDSIGSDSLLFLLTTSENDEDFFFTTDTGNPRNAFVYLDLFSLKTTVDPDGVAANHIIGAILETLLIEGGVGFNDIYHKDVRACLFDFCENKEDLVFSLKSADICGECSERLNSFGIPDSLMRQITNIREDIRRSAINVKKFLEISQPHSRWPYPVSVLRHKTAQAGGAMYQFKMLMDYFDGLLRFILFAIAVESQSKVAFDVEKPSLGKWLEKLNEMSNGHEGVQEFVKIAKAENIVKLRNDLIGHGYATITEGEFTRHKERMRKVLESVDKSISQLLDNWCLFVPKSINIEDGVFIISGQNLVGSNMLHPHLNVTLDQDPRNVGISDINHVYLTDHDFNYFKCMSPYVIVADCPACNHPRVLLWDAGNTYIDVFVGHRVHLASMSFT